MKLIPHIYKDYNGNWWHGYINRCGLLPDSWVISEFWWILRNGEYHHGWNWPALIFGIGRDWYDGPIYFLHLGVWSIDLSPAKIKKGQDNDNKDTLK